MSRFLLVVPPFRGHVLPMVSVARELERRGHCVAWVAHRSEVGDVLPPNSECFAAMEDRTAVQEHAIERELAGQRGYRSLRFFWEVVVADLCRTMTPDVDLAIRRFDPDVIVSDQYCLAGAFGARRAGVRWATVATNTGFLDPALEATPRVGAWIERLLTGLQEEAGLDPIGRPDLSPDLVVVFSSREFLGDHAVDDPRFRYVGAVVGATEEHVDFPWHRLVQGQRVLVTLGTTAGDRGRRFLAAALAGVAHVGAQAIAVVDGWDDVTSSDAIVLPRIPQLEVLSVVDAVICHGGHNTVCEALLQGLPLMVAPLTYDQPANARLVQRWRCGTVVSARRATARSVADALEPLLGDPGFRSAAGRAGEALRAGGGATAVAEALAGLAA